MLTNQQQQIIQNSHILPQPSQSFSHSPISPSQHTTNNATPSDFIKQTIHPQPLPLPSSSSSSPTATTVTAATAPVTNPTAAETIENSHISISPSPTPLSLPHTSEAVQPSVPSDTQPQVRYKILKYNYILFSLSINLLGIR